MNDKWVMKELAAAGVTCLAGLVKLIKDNEGNPGKLKALGMDTGEQGGYAVPENFSDRIMTGAPPADSIIRPRALVVSGRDAPDGKIALPELRWSSGAYGGITFAQAAYEGIAGQSVEPRYDGILLDPQRTSAFFTIGNALLRNVPAMNTIVETTFRNAKAGWEQNLFIQGAGLTGPLGVLNALSAIRVPRSTAGTVKYADVLGMFLKSYGSPDWIANMSVLPALVSLSDDEGHMIFDASDGMTLLGRTLHLTRQQPALGSTGDLMLVDPSYYAIADGSMTIIASQHPLYTSDLTLIRLSFWIDGQPWLRTPLTLEDGTTASPIVVLQ